MEVEYFNWILPPNAWSKKPYQSTYKMTREDAAKRFPGAEPVLNTREVRHGGSGNISAAESKYDKR